MSEWFSSADGDGDFSQFAPATILVADDVALNRALLAGYFEGTAHKLITATNGLEALEQAADACRAEQLAPSRHRSRPRLGRKVQT